eukprot:TRINITY_DN7656_c0_g1_i1.p1 TRINITY_DN7656_c0_g1~~TRINITY_DN7656_c0_g1_i1.p1  ORF type:complete len:327 (+),score=-20.66 TRINITY_DN7656_c0_g1_i1:481-1461(+)
MIDMADENRCVAAEIPGAVRLYTDGTIHRTPETTLFPSSGGRFIDGVATTDVQIDGQTGLWARVFQPETAPPNAKPPIVIFFHGGAFCTGNPSLPEYHRFCSTMAAETGAVWLSVAYRRSPEYRLPAAVEDAITAVLWIDGQKGPASLPFPADPARCFLVGLSAGAALVHQAVLSVSSRRLLQTRILGLVLLHPGFLKPEVSRSEVLGARGPGAPVTLGFIEDCLRMILPPNAGRDYFLLCPNIPAAAEIRLPPALVVGGKLDAFYDRNVEYCREMMAAGQEVEAVDYDDVGHFAPFEDEDDVAVDERRRVRHFILSRASLGHPQP